MVLDMYDHSIYRLNCYDKPDKRNHEVNLIIQFWIHNKAPQLIFLHND